jgi:hypothetical protein
LDVDAGVLLQEIDARAGALDLAADRRRHSDPVVVRAAEILDRIVDRTVQCDQLLHDLVDGLQVLGLVLRPPGRHGDDVVPGSGLRFGSNGEEVLGALRGHVIDRDFNLFFLRPFIDEVGRGGVGAGHPMVPKHERQLARGVSGMHERRRQRRRGRRSRPGHELPSGEFRLPHFLSSPPICAGTNLTHPAGAAPVRC